jgi:hypothetical protein
MDWGPIWASWGAQPTGVSPTQLIRDTQFIPQEFNCFNTPLTSNYYELECLPQAVALQGPSSGHLLQDAQDGSIEDTDMGDEACAETSEYWHSSRKKPAYG